MLSFTVNSGSPRRIDVASLSARYPDRDPTGTPAPPLIFTKPKVCLRQGGCYKALSLRSIAWELLGAGRQEFASLIADRFGLVCTHARYWTINRCIFLVYDSGLSCDKSSVPVHCSIPIFAEEGPGNKFTTSDLGLPNSFKPYKGVTHSPLYEKITFRSCMCVLYLHHVYSGVVHGGT